MVFYNIAWDPDDAPTNINILESKGTRKVEGSGISSDHFLKPLKIKKVNIGPSDNPKFANIGYYWDEETVAKITDLLHEPIPYQLIRDEGDSGRPRGDENTPVNRW